MGMQAARDREEGFGRLVDRVPVFVRWPEEVFAQDVGQRWPCARRFDERSRIWVS
jgi:hypothetical protein